MKQSGIIRQGDVLLIPIDALPKNATLKAREKAFVVLAYGEVTGHAHVIDDRRATFPAELYDTDRGPALRVGPGSALVHTDRFDTVRDTLQTTQEHGTVLVERTYRVVNQRQHTPWGEQRVQD
jgi:hypothetical protein